MLDKQYPPAGLLSLGQQPALPNHSTATTALVNKGNQAPTSDEWSLELKVKFMCHPCLTLSLKVKEISCHF